MRPGTGDFQHETAFYDSDESFLDAVGPFLSDGLRAGEPVVAAFSVHRQDLVRRAFGNGSGIRYVDGALQYVRPAATIHRYRQMINGYLDAGALRIRVTGEVPAPVPDQPWEWWLRYEGAVNRAFEGLPVWGLCPYDTRRFPAEVLEQMRTLHPRPGTSAADVPVVSAPAWRDPLEAGPPMTELTDPAPEHVRDALAAVRRATLLADDDYHGLVLGVNEAMTNAVSHGMPPLTVRLWHAPQRLVVTVTDRGPGPSDPFVGLLPSARSLRWGGLGLWLAHQMCGYVGFERDDEGFTVRLVAGRGEETR